MKKVFNIFIATGILISLFFSCTGNFEEIDLPKTTSDNIDAKYLFTRALVTGSGLSVGVWQLVHQTSGSGYAQYWANINSNFTYDNYEPGPGNTVWDWYYSRTYFAPLNLNHNVIKLATAEGNPIKVACARIWNVYMYQLLTDMYGDIPYFSDFESLKPVFDKQSEIYPDLLNELSQSIAQIKENRTKGFPGNGTADVLYNGDLDKWIAFANTLGMRIALRASNVAESEITQPFFAQLNLSETMLSNADMAKIIPDPNGPTYHVKNPLGYVYGWHEVRISETLMNYLDGYSDPRITRYAEPNTNGLFVGLRNGQPTDSLSQKYNSYYKPNFCNIGSFFTNPNALHYLLTYSEACFLKAEAAFKGYIAGNAQDFYEEGIRASMAQLGVVDVDSVNNYLAGSAAFNPTIGLEQIYTQRWIALYPNGHEAWSLVRQTGVPQMLQPVYTFPGNDQMPRRVPYPLDERRYNMDNYDKAVANMGGDSQYTRVWWDGGNK